MDPQSRKALDKDLEKLQGKLSYNDAGLLSFNLFMHIFIVITRHSKEQFLKEQRKTVDRRRKAYKLKSWKEYQEIVQGEIDVERLKYQDVVNYTLTYLEIIDGAYKSSFIKYSMKRVKER